MKIELPRPARLSMFLAVALAALVAGAARADASSGAYYLALGDSIAQGYQPIGGPASPYAHPGYNQGYPEQLVKLVRGRYERLRLVDLACFGESTRTLIEGSTRCRWPAGSQLDQAEVFLDTHEGEIAFITITIGANDVIGTESNCFDAATLILDAACIHAQLPTIQANIAEIVRRLQAKAPGVPIIGSTYYNPLLGAWVLVPGPVGQILSHASVAPVELLDSGLTTAYVHAGTAVADVYGAFESTDFAEQIATEWGLVPVNVANACAWSWFCSKQYTGDIHPTDAGHSVIAAAFAEALRS